jgi:hypothetical protein
MHPDWRTPLSIGLLISYPWLFRGLLGGIHRLWHPDALTYVAHPLFDIARVSLAGACAAIVSGLLAYVIVFKLQVRALFMVWLGISVAALGLYFLPLMEHNSILFFRQLLSGGLGNAVMALVVISMPGITTFLAIVLANKSLQGTRRKRRAPEL